MGMFNDNVGPRRTDWTYKYLGKDLIEPAVKLFREFQSKEEAARNKMADFMKDMNVSQNDRRIEETKRDIATFGSLKEQCEVFKHEFKRNPEKEYELGLGDVTFFGLAKE
jgi:hypothetical protein